MYHADPSVEETPSSDASTDDGSAWYIGANMAF